MNCFVSLDLDTGRAWVALPEEGFSAIRDWDGNWYRGTLLKEDLRDNFITINDPELAEILLKEAKDALPEE